MLDNKLAQLLEELRKLLFSRMKLLILFYQRQLTAAWHFFAAVSCH